MAQVYRKAELITVAFSSLTPDLAQVPRARGEAWLKAKRRGEQSVLADLRMSGALKLLFPRGGGLEAVLLNTAGGLTGGDVFSVAAALEAGSHLTMTTQAAERVYRSAGGWAEMTTSITVGAGGSLHWLPQETILFDGGALRRQLKIDLAEDARLVMVEPMIFGRAAMGELVRDAALDDRIELTRGGVPLYLDRAVLSGDIHATLARAAFGGGAGAMASLVFIAPSAEAECAALQSELPETAGVSRLAPDVMVLRALAEDGYALRQILLPVLDRLTGNTLPKCWRL